MKTKELIKKLQEIDPTGEGEVEVPVGSFTRAYPSACLKPFDVTPVPCCQPSDLGRGVRIHVIFPEGFRISKFKRKAPNET